MTNTISGRIEINERTFTKLPFLDELFSSIEKELKELGGTPVPPLSKKCPKENAIKELIKNFKDEKIKRAESAKENLKIAEAELSSVNEFEKSLSKIWE